MEMEVFTSQVSDSFGKCLSTFLIGLDENTGTPLARRSKSAMYDANGNIIDKKNNEDVKKIVEPRIDLSTMTAALKPVKEMQETLLAGSISAKETSKQQTYDSNGNLIKQWVERDDDNDEDAVHGINLSAGAAAKRAAREVNSILKTKKSGGTVGDRLKKYQNDCKPRGNRHHEGDNHDEQRLQGLESTKTQQKQKGFFEMMADAKQNEEEESGEPKSTMDLSTQGNLKKKAAELEALRSTGTQRKGVKDKIYNEKGQLNAWDKLKESKEAPSLQQEEENKTSEADMRDEQRRTECK